MRGFDPPSEYMPDEKAHRRDIARKLSLAMQGGLNVVSTVTLTVSVATTVVIDARIGANTFLGLQPMTANAAAALATTYVSSQQKGQATLTHANNAQADRTFRLLMVG
jgi:hypothetical protein